MPFAPPLGICIWRPGVRLYTGTPLIQKKQIADTPQAIMDTCRWNQTIHYALP